MNLQNMQYLLEISDSGSLSAAAKAVCDPAVPE